MQTRSLGNATVSSLGLGGMPLSVPGRPDREQAIATIHAALDAGITFIDTADAYTSLADGQGHNESLIAEALASYGPGADQVLVATKGGLVYTEPSPWQRNGKPAYLADAAQRSRDRLGVESIGLYQYHRIDPEVPLEESVTALAELASAGVVTRIGLSNVVVDEIERARAILGERLVSVQNRFSPTFRDHQPELDYCSAHGLAFLPWSPLGGSRESASLGGAAATFAEIAADHGVSPQRLTLAWMQHLSPVVIPIPGSRRPETIVDSAAADQVTLTADEVARLNAAA